MGSPRASRLFGWIVAAALLAPAAAVHAQGVGPSPPDSLDAIAREFVVWGLVFHRHDRSPYIYTGPDDLKRLSETHAEDLPGVLEALSALRARLVALPVPPTEDEARRRRDLLARLVALDTRGRILSGDPPAGFDEETRLLFGIEAPRLDEAHFRALTAELDALVPGEGELADRMESLRARFVIPPDRLEQVIGAAMAECRTRTLAHLALPPGESVTLHIARDKPWVGFTLYRGKGHSDIYLNADVPVHIERAIELGCHEGYPGHHVHATLLEEAAVKDRGWTEYSLISLLGPLAVIAEGAASHAMDLAFTQEERFRFERETLLPMAGIDATDFGTYYRFVGLVEELNFARNEAARRYLYEGLPRENAIRWLMTYGLETRKTAEQRLDFIDDLRSYVVTYNVGRRLVRGYIERTAGSDADARWRVFRDVLVTPLMPVDISP